MQPALENELNPGPIRIACPFDIPWMLDLASESFTDFNKSDTEDFLSEIMHLERCIIFRGNHDCVGAHVYEWPYNNSIRFSEELFMASDGKSGWELYDILKKIIAWARRKNVRWFDFHLGEASKTGKSLEPFAKRLGAIALGNNTYRVIMETAH